MAPRLPTALRARVLPIGLALAAFAGSLLVAELGLRLAGLPFREEWTPSEYALARFDPELGWSYVPGRSATQPFGDPPRAVTMHFDGLGARVASPDRPSAEGRPSVLLVGDSFTMGHGVPYEETFAGRLARALPVQVVNLGVQAYGTDQALLRLRATIDRFDTRAVVHTFIGEQVLRDAVDDPRLWIPSARFRGTKPRFALDADGRLVQVAHPLPASELRLAPRLLALVRSVRHRFGPPPGPELTRAILREMQRETHARRAVFVAVNWVQANYPSFDSVFAGAGIARIDAREGAPPEWDSWVIPGDGHPDARAHAHAAARILAALPRFEARSSTPPRPASPPGRPEPVVLAPRSHPE